MAESLSSVTGLSSGFDYRALVDQIIKLDRRPADRMQATVDANAKRKTAVGELRAAFATLQSAAEGLKGGAAVDRMIVGATGADALGRTLLAAAPTAGAVPGSYSVTVERLAAGQKTVGSAGVASTGALGLAGTFSVNGSDVVVDAADSIAAVRDKVNALSATTGVRASVVVGGPSDARLVLNSTGTGAATAFAVADVSGTLAGTTFGLTGAPAQEAQDARVVVDGIVAERATNTFTDLVPGVTLNLAAADPLRPASVTVSRDPQAGAEALKGFVEAFNKARALSRTLTATGGALAGDQMPRNAASALSSALLAADPDLADDMATLSAAGVSLQKDGTLAFDADRYQTAAARPDDLRALLASRMGALAEQAEFVAQPILGLADRRTAAIDEQTLRLEARISEADARLEKKRASLLAQYAKFEAALGAIRSAGDSLTAQLKGLTASADK